MFINVYLSLFFLNPPTLTPFLVALLFMASSRRSFCVTSRVNFTQNNFQQPALIWLSDSLHLPPSSWITFSQTCS
uniref:Putative secreted protein n=1 Tax=Anopheles darlingi TaxID=43151 RepID=A0A2M4DAN0_ANODA